jgi:hypothetical protein
MKYFAYGSNMNPERMRGRNINFSSRERAILRGWKLEFNKEASRNPKEGYANIVPDENGIVEGILIVIEVQLDNGQKVMATTYVANPSKVKEGLKPTREYLNHLLKGCDIPSKEYCKNLKSSETLD